MHDSKFIPVENFPPWYPWYRRLWANITYWLSLVSLWKRGNMLTKSDIHLLWSAIKTWDIILVWNFQHASGFLIEWVVTHALAYVWKWRCIHAFAHGVNYIWLKKVTRIYDTYILIRPYYQHEGANIFHKELVSHIGKPYDFFFGADKEHETYFCTRLVNDALLASWYNTNLKSIKEGINFIDQALDRSYAAHRVLKPNDMIYGNFEIVLYSHNLILENGKYAFRDWILWKLMRNNKTN